ncbi:response regulator transcription factor [Rhodococcus wratislaviensis]|uniref:response regulator transcription factor n=1 Tax=Rhodococcus wratislaviensis TaxID=44752 RepID=UPI0012DBF1CD|nr:response regulator transcription factor [Rhodococcus wratislaviensis]
MTSIRLYRDGVAEALRRFADVENATTAATGAEAVVAIGRSDCDVVLVDMSLSGSADAVRALVVARPTVKVVALGVLEDDPGLAAYAELGVCGYVSRDASIDELGESLRSALRGEAPCSGKIAAGLLRHIAVQARAHLNSQVPLQLTCRERDVLKLLENGMTNKEIARALDISLSTVKNHVHSVLVKMGAAHRHELSGGLAAGNAVPSS